MNTAVMFSKASDEWETPQAFFDALHAEFDFDLDAAASSTNRKCGFYFTAQDDALTHDWVNLGGLEWLEPATVWCNPPYSRVAAFVAKTHEERLKGCTVVMLIPSRTDTRWWHEYIWDRETQDYRPGVEVRFVKGRLKFGDSQNSAPFPSVVVVFRPVS